MRPKGLCLARACAFDMRPDIPFSCHVQKCFSAMPSSACVICMTMGNVSYGLTQYR